MMGGGGARAVPAHRILNGGGGGARTVLTNQLPNVGWENHLCTILAN